MVVQMNMTQDAASNTRSGRCFLRNASMLTTMQNSTKYTPYKPNAANPPISPFWAPPCMRAGSSSVVKLLDWEDMEGDEASKDVANLPHCGPLCSQRLARERAYRSPGISMDLPKTKEPKIAAWSHGARRSIGGNVGAYLGRPVNLPSTVTKHCYFCDRYRHRIDILAWQSLGDMEETIGSWKGYREEVLHTMGAYCLSCFRIADKPDQASHRHFFTGTMHRM